MRRYITRYINTPLPPDKGNRRGKITGETPSSSSGLPITLADLRSPFSPDNRGVEVCNKNIMISLSSIMMVTLGRQRFFIILFYLCNPIFLYFCSICTVLFNIFFNTKSHFSKYITHNTFTAQCCR